jgi:hypothetical protein
MENQIRQKRIKFGLQILLSVFFLFSLFPSKADYAPVSLTSMIFKADLVVCGEIDSLSRQHFFLKITKKVYGNYSGIIIRVKKFHNWTCAQRWKDYEKGQNVFLFLQKDANKNWVIMSAGGEGELPILKENIYLFPYQCSDMPFVSFEKIGTDGKQTTSKFEEYKLYGANFTGVRLSLDEFASAVEDARACFQFVKGEEKIKQICSNEQLQAYKNKSPMNNWLAEKIGKQ